jgi:hypothetical protein
MVLVEEVWAEREEAPSAAAASEALPMKSRLFMGHRLRKAGGGQAEAVESRPRFMLK